MMHDAGSTRRAWPRLLHLHAMRFSIPIFVAAVLLWGCGTASGPLAAQDRGQPAGGATHHLPSASGEPAPDLDVDFSLAKGLKIAWGTGKPPGRYEADEGAFRFVCGGDGPLRYDDPVVYPGKPGAAHLHQVWGNRSFGADTTPDSLAKSASTNCNDSPFSLNRSSYWQPALLHDSGQVVRPDLVVIYYKRKTASSPACDRRARGFLGICTGLPNRIRFIMGWDQTRPRAKVAGASWYCSGAQGHYPNLDAVFAAGCKPGDDLIANTVGPNCWDGRALDSADHRSHMSYAMADPHTGQGRCPATHPYLIPQQENKAQFTVTADMIGPGRRSRVGLSSDSMLPGAKPGETLHADYMEAWVTRAKALWLTHCIDKGLSCSGGELGNGTQLVGAEQPAYGWKNPKPRSSAPAKTGEHAGH